MVIRVANLFFLEIHTYLKSSDGVTSAFASARERLWSVFAECSDQESAWLLAVV